MVTAHCIQCAIADGVRGGMGKEKEREKIEIESEESLLDSGTLKMVALALFAATYIALLAFPGSAPLSRRGRR